MAAGFLFPLLVLFTTDHRLVPPIELPTKNNSPQADQEKRQSSTTALRFSGEAIVV
jgi:hypothetical protein